MGVMSLPSVERHFRRAIGELASSKWSCFARREGWKCSTGCSVGLGGAAAPKHAKRAAAPSSLTELGQQTCRSSRGVHSVRGFEFPAISIAFRKELACKIANHFVFFSCYRVWPMLLRAVE